MSLEDFARYVGMDARQVRKLAGRGKLPGVKVAGQWRFNQARVTEWLQQVMHTLDEAQLRATERALDPSTADPGSRLIVTDLIGLEGIELAFGARTRASVLRELVKLAERTSLVYDAVGLHAALQQREEMCSTAMGRGIAVPHPRQPLPYATAEPMICLARSPAGIGFGDAQGGLTDLFFLVCSHETRAHLHVLARLARMLDPATCAALRDEDTPVAALDRLIHREEQVAETTRSQ